MRKHIIFTALFLFNFTFIFAQTACPGFKTFTQGGWGSKPNGNNPGSYLQSNFTTAFPNGLTIGCNNKIILTTATAVQNFLPQGSTARKLNSGTLINPTKTIYSNVLAGQLVATMLSTKFDATIPSFAPSTQNLGNLVITTGTFKNWTVNQLLTEANKFIGGCQSNFTPTDLNTALSSINLAYDNGISSGSYLVCPILFNLTPTNVTCYNGTNGSINLVGINGGVAPYTYLWSNGMTTQNITNLTAGVYSVIVTDAIGLTKKDTIKITQPTQIIVTGNQTDDTNCDDGICDGSGTASVNGGTLPYTMVWSDGTINNNINYNLCPNTNSVIYITDGNGCKDSFVFTPGCIPGPIDNNCEPLVTFTQGGWGVTPNGNNPGTYLFGNFNSAFPKGLTIGSKNTMTLTGPNDVLKFLPSGGTPVVLPNGTMTNPTNYKNTFAGQLVAATLNVTFDYYDPNFASPQKHLGDMYCNFAPFLNITVNQVIREANLTIGGGVGAFKVSDLNMALDFINLNYDNGLTDNGDLICDEVYNVVFSRTPTTNLFVGRNQNVEKIIFIYDAQGREVMVRRTDMDSKEFINEVKINNQLTTGIYFVVIKEGSFIITDKIIIR